MDRQRIGLLLGVVLLLAAGVFLSRATTTPPTARVEPPDRAASKTRVQYPRDLPRTAERPRRMTQRPEEPERNDQAPGRDPVVAAISSAENVSAVFIEVNAIRHSPIIEEAIRCLEADTDAELERLRQELGIDLTKDIDRIALGQDAVAISGFFEDLKFPAEFGDGVAYGESGTLFEVPMGPKNSHLARIGEGLLLLGPDEASLRAAVDRVEGRASFPPPNTPEGAPSEIYGTVDATFLSKLLAAGSNPQMEQLGALIEQSQIRVLFDDAVSVSLDVQAKTPEQGRDLAKTLRGALAALRREAAQEGQLDVASLWEQARVLPGDGGAFGIDFAVPKTAFLGALGCQEPETSQDATDRAQRAPQPPTEEE